MTQNANEVTNSRSFPQQSVFAFSIHPSICTDLDSAILTIFSRHCVSAGEPLNEEVIEAWHDKTGLWIREGYGQTETTLIAATTKEMIIKPGSMGKAAPGTYSKV